LVVIFLLGMKKIGNEKNILFVEELMDIVDIIIDVG